VRCNASVGVLSASYLSYPELLNRSVIVLLLAAEVVLVPWDRPVALEVMVLGLSASCIAAFYSENVCCMSYQICCVP
jgi:hypothetical protein